MPSMGEKFVPKNFSHFYPQKITQIFPKHEVVKVE